MLMGIKYSVCCACKVHYNDASNHPKNRMRIYEFLDFCMTTTPIILLILHNYIQCTFVPKLACSKLKPFTARQKLSVKCADDSYPDSCIVQGKKMKAKLANNKRGNKSLT